MYTISYDPITGKPNGVLNEQGACIPIDAANADFVRFVDWNTQQIAPLNYSDPIQVAPPAPASEIVFDLPVRAPDFLVSSPKVSNDPAIALNDAVAESGKQKKSIAFMVLSLAKYLDELEKRLQKGKI